MQHPRTLLLLASLFLPVSAQAPSRSPAVDAGASAAPAGLSAGDWAGIADAHRAWRHAARAVEGGLEARNPGQGWSIGFDGRGVRVRPDEGAWEWGLELVRFGFAGAERAVAGTASVTSDGGRVAYAWPGGLEEWYVNGAAGLEHGFTLRERPAGGDAGGPLVLTLDVRGPLVALGNADRKGVRFADGAGRVVLRYTKLAVFDARGHTLDARLEPAAGGLRIAVDERDASYPLTIDPLAQEAYLKAAFPGGDVGGIGVTGDEFGTAVALSGERIVIGAPNEDGGSSGVNGDQEDESGTNSGAAYVFVRSGGVWSQEAYLKASNVESSGSPAVPGDRFGAAVGIAGDTIVIGAPLEDSAATGVGGNQADNSAVDAGAAYVFVRSGGVWSQEAYLKASNAENGDRFGLSVAIAGDTLIVGADREDGAATGVNGDEGNGASRAGAAYVFVREAGSWSQQAYLKASNTQANDDFGTAVALSGDTALVGAIGEDGSVPGVNGDESDNGLTHAGAAYVFVRDAGNWTQQAYLKASNPGLVDEFGSALAIEGDLAVVGAQQEDSHATVINGDQTSNRRTDAGAAYAFVRNGTTWTQEAYLKASNAAGWTGPSSPTGDHFGCALAVSGSHVLVGARWEQSDATGINGNQVSNAAGYSGAAFLFLRSGTSWNQIAYLKASNTGGADEFGRALAMDGDLMVIGAPFEDGGAGGVNPDETSAPGAGSAGAAYAFRIDSLPAVTFRNAGSNPASYAADPLVVGGTFTASVDNAAAGQLTSVIVAFNTPFELTLGAGQVLLCLDFQGNGELFTGAGLFPSSSAGGVDGYAFPFPNEPLYVGASFSTQAIQFGNPPFVLSNAQDLTIGQ